MAKKFTEAELETFIEGSTHNRGIWLELPDYAILISWDGHNGEVNMTVRSSTKDRMNNHIGLDKENVKRLIIDLQDLSDWRHYKRLMNKLNNSD